MKTILAPGPVSTPYDAQLEYNVCLLPKFDYRVKGISELHLHQNLSQQAENARDNTPDYISKVGSMVFQVVDILGIFYLVEPVKPQ